MLSAWLVFVTLGLVASPGWTFPVTISETGGYSILIAIHRDVQEDPELVETLKNLFTKSSSFLYNATRRQVYFEDVTISLPSTWSHQPGYETVLQDNFEASHFRVNTNEELDDEPYTLQPEGCGRQGRFVHLQPKYLQNLEATINDFGIPERRMVYEWARFRYGVYSEKPDASGTPYYRSGPELLPSVCTKELTDRGWSSNSIGDPCKPKDEKDKDCIFDVEGIAAKYHTAKASLMFSTSIPSIDTFCDDTPERKHNAQAPTLHNAMCNRRSTWDVISGHTDFRKLKALTNGNTDPQFRVVRASGGKGKTVMLLDISGSMSGDPIQLLHQSAEYVILHKVPENSSLGIVAFGSSSNVLKHMTPVTPATRKILANSLPHQANGGGTGIGRGLLTSVGVLRGPQGNEPVEGGVIVLITDGEETEVPKVSDVLPNLIENNIIVHVIAYGEKASDLMEMLTASTGGQLTMYRNIHDVKADNVQLVNKIAEAVTVQSNIEIEPVKVTSQTTELRNSETVIPVTLDDELGRNTIFTFSGKDLSNVEFKLTTPSKIVIDKNSPEHRKINNQVTVFRFKEAETGLYHMTILSPDSGVSVSYSLESEAKDAKKQPVKVMTWVDEREVVLPAMPKVFAEVKKGDAPVIGAHVTADVIGPDTKATIVLKDDNIAPDVFKNDGTYSGYITSINGDHRYQVMAHVKSTKKARLRRRKTIRGKIDGRARRNAPDDELTRNATMEEEVLEETVVEAEDDDDDMFDVEYVAPFERVADAGVFKVKGWKPDLGDLIPPAPVSDLRLVSVQDDVVTLSWTSSGDDMTVGNASWTVLKGARRFDDLLNSFTDQIELSSYLINGSLAPLPSGEKQTIQLFIPDTLLTTNITENGTSLEDTTDIFYFGIKSVDEANNTAELSNVVYASFFKEEIQESISSSPAWNPTMASDVEHETISNREESPSKNDSAKTSVAFIGYILAACFLGAILVAMGFYIRKRTRSYDVVRTHEEGDV